MEIFASECCFHGNWNNNLQWLMFSFCPPPLFYAAAWFFSSPSAALYTLLVCQNSLWDVAKGNNRVLSFNNTAPFFPFTHSRGIEQTPAALLNLFSRCIVGKQFYCLLVSQAHLNVRHNDSQLFIYHALINIWHPTFSETHNVNVSYFCTNGKKTERNAEMIWSVCAACH